MELTTLALSEPLEIRVYPQLKVFRKLQHKDRKNFIIYLPVEWVNGFNIEKVSMQLCQLPNKDICVLVNLTEWQKVKPKEREQK